jgi:hypothetical protein
MRFLEAEHQTDAGVLPVWAIGPDGARARVVGIAQTPSALLGAFNLGAGKFPLSWSHYVRLLSIENTHARQFYETEALRGGWRSRQLDRHVNSVFYERTALSKKGGHAHERAGAQTRG